MNTKVKIILKHWKKSIEKYNKIDDWNFHEYVSVLSGYIRNSENATHKDVRRLIRSLRDNVICPCATRRTSIYKGLATLPYKCSRNCQ